MKKTITTLALAAGAMLLAGGVRAQSLVVPDTVDPTFVQVVVPLSVVDGSGFSGVHVRLNFDPTHLESPGVIRGPLLEKEHLLTSNSPEAGKLNVVVFSTTRPAAFDGLTGTLFYLTFQVKPGAPLEFTAEIDFEPEVSGTTVIPASGVSSLTGGNISHLTAGGTVSVVHPKAEVNDWVLYE